MPVPVAGETARRFPWGYAVLGLAALALVVLFGQRLALAVPRFAAFVEGLGLWGPVAFIAGYALASVAFVPGSLLTLAGGALFGLARGTLFVLIGALLGASASFLVARYVARGAVERRLAGNQKFAAIDRAVGAEGRWIVFLLRLSPVFPFNLLNYGLGLTRVRFSDYLVASLGILPGTLLYVYYGTLAGGVARAASGSDQPKGAGHYAILGLGLLATLLATTLITRTARRALAKATADTTEPSNPT